MNRIILLLLMVSFNCLSSSDIIGSGGAVGAGQNIVIRSPISSVLSESGSLSHSVIGDTGPDFIINIIYMISDGEIEGYDHGHDEVKDMIIDID